MTKKLIQDGQGDVLFGESLNLLQANVPGVTVIDHLDKVIVPCLEFAYGLFSVVI